MELPASPSSHQFSTRKPGEPGLAEWAQKIRALQHQVDQDEEEEHRKLEREIAASRRARVRRSTGYGRVPLDPPAVPSDSPSTASSHSDAPESGSSSIVRRGEQTEGLQKLVGKPSLRPQTTPSSPAPMSLAAFIGGRATGPRLNKHAPQMDATEPTLFEQRSINTSSAPHPVFGRGGIAMPGLTSRGRGVVSPIEDHGVDQLASTASTQVHSPIVKHEPASNTESVLVSNSDRGFGGEATRQPRTGAPYIAFKRYMQHVEKVTSTQATKPSPECDASRPRTVSTPNPTDTHLARSTTLPPPILSSRVHSGSPHGRIPSRSPDLDARSPPPTFDSNLPPQKSPTFPPSKPSEPFITPKKPAIASTSSPASGAKLPTFSAFTPSLPRPEVSTQKAILLTPQRRMPSLHPQKEKDPTPSISRLKGRGFVQSMVKASSVLEAAAAGSATPEAGKLSPAKSSPSNSNRWKLESSCSSPSQPGTSVPTNYRKSWTPSATTPSLRTVTQRKSWTTLEPQKVEDSLRERPARALGQQSASSVRVVESHHIGRPTHATEHQRVGQSPLMPGSEQTEHPPRKAPSLPSLSTPSRPNTPPPASPGGHGLGSSSTMFSYIKPTKTGDDPTTGPSLPHSRPTTPHSRVSAGGLESTQDVDELGHRTGVSLGGRRQRNGMAGFPAPSGRPLVHLTKGRPKPKKANRRDTGERLAEARTMTTLASLPHVQTCGISKAAVPTPSSTHVTPSAARLIGTASHADVPTQFSTHLPTSKRDSNTTDRWDGHGLIGVPSSDSAASKPQEKTFLIGLTQPLPGLSIPSPPLPLRSQVRPSSPSPRSPRRQSRIPSTGSRTLVMDVAQALQEAQAPTTEAGSSSKGSVPVAAQPQAELHAPPIEKRKSSSDKYMDRVMPPLVEERTATIRGANPELVTRVDVKINLDVRVQERGSPDDILAVQPGDDYIEIPHHNEPLPRVDLDKLLLPVSAYQPSADVTTISIDIMSVTGATATGVKGNTVVFYDSEILAIVHRAKAKSSGLVETTLWGWQGRRSQIGEREQRKMKDMARHYGTKLCPVHQGCEPAELVHALGGRLAIRQGMRSYWSAENTTMHQVRLMNGLVSIDEHDFVSDKHLGEDIPASYCLTLLGTCYVWHGKGSLPGERQAALEYALSLVTGSRPVELVEQVSDDNEMFWMMLGDADYARADYWKWRPDLAATALPRIWRVDASSTPGPHLTIVPTFSTESNIDLSVYLLDCIWELFILVGTKARKARRDIRLALSIARDLSSRLATDRPFMPPIHTLILPSKIPLDLRLHFRDLDEELVNGTPPPDHMNLLELLEAQSDLERIKWEKTRLKDLAMLPLGIDPTCLP